MKYSNLSLGRIEAIVNRLGGMDGVERFLRGELVVSESTRSWREKDGVISAIEMDMVAPSAGMGNRNGKLDTTNERRYITDIRVKLGSDKNRDGKTEYAVETDIYPLLLPLKNR